MSAPSVYYDVIVVGAGPSGSTLARKLAIQGRRVLLLDKSEFPRYKVCGGGLTLRAAKQLDINIDAVVRDEIYAMELCCDGDYRHTFAKDNPFIYMVMRDEFDMLLLQEATQAGVEFRPLTRVRNIEHEEHSVRVITDRGVFEAALLVGADGVNSIVATQCGLMTKKERILALEYEMKVDEEVLARFHGKVAIDYGFIKGGYAWVFPKHDHLSVGVGLGTKNGQFLQDKLFEYLAREKVQGEFLSEKGFFLSVGGTDSSVVKGRVALLGDAAGLVDPFMGEGIYYALRSANILAEVMAGFTFDSLPAQPFADYQARVEREIMMEMKLFKRASQLFYTMPKQVHKLFIRQPKMVDSAFRVIAGEISFEEYFERYRGTSGKLKAISGFAMSLFK